MTLSYDQDADALAIVLRDDRLVARTVEIDPGTLVDVDENGQALAIEVIRPARTWPLEQVIQDFNLEDEDADVLRAMWAESERYPFAPPLELPA